MGRLRRRDFAAPALGAGRRLLLSRSPSANLRRYGSAAGESKYPLTITVRFAIDAIIAFSVVPLTASMTIGWVMAAIGRGGSARLRTPNTHGL